MTTAAQTRTALEARLADYSDDTSLPHRQAALEQFLQRGFPGTRHEDWKYTDLAHAAEINHQALGVASDTTVDTSMVAHIRDSIDADWLVIANGALQFDETDIPAGISIAPSSGCQDIADPLADLNAVLATTDITIHVAANTRLERPIGLLFIDHTGTVSAVTHARVAIEIENGGTAAFIEYHHSSGETEHYANVFVSADVAAQADIHYVRLQNRARHHLQTARMNVQLQTGATFRHFGLDLGAALARNDLKVSIDAPDATAEFNGLYIGGDKQHIDNHTRVDHRVGPAQSIQEYRGILAGRSRGVWNGKAVVHDGADGTDAEQANHNLLLSPHSEINAKPELEIYADEVKCSHGTTVGQLDEKAIFYLRSRGLGEDDARRILTRAFATSVVDKLPLEALRETISRQVEERLAELGAEDRR